MNLVILLSWIRIHIDQILWIRIRSMRINITAFKSFLWMRGKPDIKKWIPPISNKIYIIYFDITAYMRLCITLMWNCTNWLKFLEYLNEMNLIYLYTSSIFIYAINQHKVTWSLKNGSRLTIQRFILHFIFQSNACITKWLLHTRAWRPIIHYGLFWA